MTNAGVASLANAFSTNDSILETLVIRNNEIYEEGASHIAELLNSTCIVSTLRLNDNPIGDKGLQTIFGALKLNKALKYLSVNNCGMTNIGVASLADALHTNNTLERLFIRANTAISENGLTCLVEAVSRHSGLVELWIPTHLEECKVRMTVNAARNKNGLPNIKLNDMLFI